MACNIVLKNYFKHYTPRSDKEPASKDFKISLNYFVLSFNISEMIDCHIHVFTNAWTALVLLVKPGNFSENLNQTFCLNLGIDWIKVLVKPVNSVNFSLSKLCWLYLLPEILTASFLFNIYQCRQEKYRVPLIELSAHNIIFSYGWKCYSKSFQ